MQKKNKLQSILKALTPDSTQVDFSQFDEATAKLKDALKEKVQAQTLDDVNAQLEKFRKRIDLTPLVESVKNIGQNFSDKSDKVEELKSELQSKVGELDNSIGEVESLKSELQSKWSELDNSITTSNTEKAASSDYRNKLYSDIANLKSQLFDLETTREKDVTNLQSKITELGKIGKEIEVLKKTIKDNTDLDNKKDLESAKEAKKQLGESQKSLESLRAELLTRISNIGGGAQNQRIQVNGVLMSTKYVDINLKGTGVSAADNNTTKQVDITFVGGGGSGTVSSVASADGSITVTNPTTTVDLAVVKSPKLSTARTIAGVSFDGTANIAIPASGLSNGVIGSGAIVLATSPTLTTAVLGSSTATTQAPADNSTKLATTAYVDNAILGQRFKEAVKYASIAALPSIVYANGSSGVGATLTGVALAAISLDSSSPAVADRVLIKNQAAPEQNGIYTVTATGSGIAVFVLTRATDFDQASDIQTGDSVFVTAGSTLASTTWAYTGIDSPTMGTSALTFVQAAGPGSYTQGNGITITGVSIAIDTSVTVDKTTAQTLTNKTIVSSTDILGGVTMTLGSDGNYDTYYRNSSGILTRLANGTTGQFYGANTGAAPSWQTPAGGSSIPKVIQSTLFEASGRFSASAVGGGSNGFGGVNGLTQATSNTISSGAQVTWQIGNGGDIFKGSPSFGVNLNYNSNPTDFKSFFGLGSVTLAGAGITYTPAHAGFKITRAASGTISLFATQSDGSTENASSALTTVAVNDDLELILQINDTSSIDYYWRKNGGALSSATNLTANMPTTATDYFVNFTVSNVGVATGGTVLYYGANFQR